MPNVTPLAQRQITPVSSILIELVEDVATPAAIREPARVVIHWPAASTIVDPKRFPDTAATIAQLFARAHIVLAALKANGR
jgi:hypothetical protein